MCIPLSGGRGAMDIAGSEHWPVGSDQVIIG